jgi:NHL repeat
MDRAGRMLVADRGNNRIQVFDQGGKFIAEYKAVRPGCAPSCG